MDKFKIYFSSRNLIFTFIFKVFFISTVMFSAIFSCHKNITRSFVPMESWKIISDRSESPWSGLTSSWEEEERSKIVQATTPNSNYTALNQLRELLFENKPILYRSEKERKVIVDSQFFSDLVRVDATKLEAEKRIVIGKVKNPKIFEPRFLLPFLIRSQIIQTYIHTDSELEFINEEKRATEIWYYFQGVHHYYTNSKNTGILKFIIVLDSSSFEISILGQ